MTTFSLSAARVLSCALLLAFIATSATRLSAAQVGSSWTTATSGNWTDAARWSAGVPQNGGGNTYDATIIATGFNYTVTLSTSQTINSLTLDSANATLLQTAGSQLNLVGANATSALLAGNLRLNGAGISANGSNHVFSNAGLIESTVSGTRYIYGSSFTFTNSGTVTSSGGGALGIGSVGTPSGQTVINTASGVMTADGGTLTLGTGTNTVANAGTV
ncbi:MAG: hypothetical protein ABIZ81_10840, partial [Opitutaceae bacterium]